MLVRARSGCLGTRTAAGQEAVPVACSGDTCSATVLFACSSICKCECECECECGRSRRHTQHALRIAPSVPHPVTDRSPPLTGTANPENQY